MDVEGRTDLEALSETHTSHPHPGQDRNCQAAQQGPDGFLLPLCLEVPRAKLLLGDLVTLALSCGYKQEMGRTA